MIKLTITEKGGEPRSLVFDKDEVFIGRVQSNDVVLPKGNISKRHTRLEAKDGTITVSDLQSTNGTFVNNRKIAEATVLKPGDKIFVGDFLLLVDQRGDQRDDERPAALMPPPPPPPPPGRATAARATVAGMDTLAASSASEELDDLLNIAPAPKSGLRNRPAAVLTPPPPPPPPRRNVLAETATENGTPAPAGNIEEESGSLFAGGRTDIVDEDAPALTTGPHRDGLAETETALRPPSAPTSPSRPVTGPQPVSTNVPASGPVATGDSSFDALVTNPAVTAVFVAGTDVHVERDGRLQRIPLEADANTLADAVWQLAMTALAAPSSENPVVDVRWADGSQLRALYPPLVASGVVATLRRAHLPSASLADVAGHRDVASVLQAALEARRNLLVVGPHPAALLLMGALAQALPSERRVVGFGTGLEGRPGWIEVGAGGEQTTILRTAGAVPADHVVIGEALSQNLTEAWIAAPKSLQGVLAFVSGRSLTEGLAKVETLAASRLGPLAPSFLVETIDLVVSVNAFGDDGAWVTSLAELEVKDGRLTAVSCAESESTQGPPRLSNVRVSARLAGALRQAGAQLDDGLVRSA
jgi:pilus assembly protein CpaF